MSTFNGQSIFVIDSMVKDQSILGENMDTEIRFGGKINETPMNAHLKFNAQSGQLRINGSGKYNTLTKFFKLSGSSTSFDIETDIGTEVGAPISLTGKVRKIN